MKHRGRLPAEPVAEFKAATGQQTPGHPSRHGYAISRSCRIERVTPTHTHAPDGMLTRDWRYAAMLLRRLPVM